MSGVKHGGGEGDASGAVCPATSEQQELAAAEVVALLVTGVLQGRGRPHGAEGAGEAGMEWAVGLRDLRLRDGGRQRHPQPSRTAPVQGVSRGQGGEGSSAALPPLPHIVDDPPVAGRRGAYAEAGQAATGAAGGRRCEGD